MPERYSYDEDNPFEGGKGGLGLVIVVLLLTLLAIQLFAVGAAFIHSVGP